MAVYDDVYYDDYEDDDDARRTPNWWFHFEVIGQKSRSRGQCVAVCLPVYCPWVVDSKVQIMCSCVRRSTPFLGQ